MGTPTTNLRPKGTKHMLEYCPQNIEINLPCKPFSCKESRQIGSEEHLFFEPTGDPEYCPDCGRPMTTNQWRNINLAGPPVLLAGKSIWHVKYKVLSCRDCGYYRSQEIPFRFMRTKCTTYLARMICEDLRSHNSTIKDVSRRYSIGWWLTRSVHMAFLRLMKDRCPPPQPPEVVAVDEFSVEKNHRYATLVIDARTKMPLFLHRGNSSEDFAPFFHMCGKEFYSRIKAFAMDQNATYASVVRQYLPRCLIVCDYFHMIKNYNDEVVDVIRKRMVRDALIHRDSARTRRLKWSRRLVMKRIGEEDIEARLALKDLMDESAEMDTAVHMRESLQLLYDNCRDADVMKAEWEVWLRMAMVSGIPELMAFATKKARKSEEVINHARYAISSGVMEGCIAKIKVLKRVAYGFRNWDYFFMRIWHSFLPRGLCERLSEEVWESIENGSIGGMNDDNRGTA